MPIHQSTSKFGFSLGPSSALQRVIRKLNYPED